MNDLYDHYIEYRGRLYRYDPDHDCFYAVNQPMTSWDRFGWLAVLFLLTALALYLEYLR